MRVRVLGGREPDRSTAGGRVEIRDQDPLPEDAGVRPTMGRQPVGFPGRGGLTMIKHALPFALLVALAFVPSPGQAHHACNITVKTAGSGPTFFNVCVSTHGNVAVFATPTNHIFDEGYAVCRNQFTPELTLYFDYDNADSGWGPASTTDLTPVTIVRTTTDGVFTLTQKFAVDTVEMDLTITMTLKNNTAVTQTSIALMRGGDFDAGGSTSNMFTWSLDSVVALTFAGGGLSLTATSFATAHAAAVPPSSASGTRDCSTLTLAPPITGDHGGRVIYFLGDIGAGMSKTVKVTYRRQ
jgi:hypothetical protein